MKNLDKYLPEKINITTNSLTVDNKAINISQTIPSAPKVQMTGGYHLGSVLNKMFITFQDTIAWLQGISHIFINSTVESGIPVHVAWYFRYYQVSGAIQK